MLRIGLLMLPFVLLGCAAPSTTMSIADRASAFLVPHEAIHETTECIYLHRVRSTRVIDRIGIAYEMPDRKVWLNRPKWGASSLNGYLVMITQGSRNKLCAGDIVQFVDSSLVGFRSAVALGPFIRSSSSELQRSDF